MPPPSFDAYFRVRQYKSHVLTFPLVAKSLEVEAVASFRTLRATEAVYAFVL